MCSVHQRLILISISTVRCRNLHYIYKTHVITLASAPECDSFFPVVDKFPSQAQSLASTSIILQNNVRCGVFPASLSSMALTVGGYNALYLTKDTYAPGFDVSLGLVDRLRPFIKLWVELSTNLLYCLAFRHWTIHLNIINLCSIIISKTCSDLSMLIRFQLVLYCSLYSSSSSKESTNKVFGNFYVVCLVCFI